jgi:hypothetical protein
MYINYKILQAKPFYNSPLIVLVLQALRQNRTEDTSGYIESLISENDLKNFEVLGLVSFVKPKNKSHGVYHCARLTEKGVTALDNLTTPVADEKDVQMSEYLCDMYMKEGEIVANDTGEPNPRKVGNRKRVTMYIAQFRKALGLDIYEMYWLCHLFVKEFKYTMVLENIFFDRNKNRYGKFTDNIDDSKLYQFYKDNEERVQEYWRKKMV